MLGFAVTTGAGVGVPVGAEGEVMPDPPHPAAVMPMIRAAARFLGQFMGEIVAYRPGQRSRRQLATLNVLAGFPAPQSGTSSLRLFRAP